MEIYVVKPMDTVYRIAGMYGLSPETVIRYNQLAYPYSLAVGQALLIPVSGSGQTMPVSRSEQTIPVSESGQTIPVSNSGFAMSEGTADISGYAYPFISEAVLQATLPYLSELNIFSYGFTREGMLLPPTLPVERMIRGAYQLGAKPVLTLTPLDEEGRFNNEIISVLVTDSGVQERLIQELLKTMQELGYQGIDVDFEYIKAQDRDAFTTFVAKLSRRMNEYGYELSVALAPKVSDDQQGLLYQGKDYGGLGAAANKCLLMTYEWGYSRSEPKAVAPIDSVRRVVDYAITKIPRAKLRLGIPNYGYDWTLPYRKGESVARSVGNQEAVELAVTFGAQIEYDEIAKTPHFRYAREGLEHEVWFEDVRSFQAKYRLIQEYGLGGAGYWQIMRLFLPGLYLLQDMFAIRKA